jgi:hypothetical protein
MAAHFMLPTKGEGPEAQDRSEPSGNTNDKRKSESEKGIRTKQSVRRIQRRIAGSIVGGEGVVAMTPKPQRQPGRAGAGEAALLKKLRSDVTTSEHIATKRPALAALLRPKTLATEANSGGVS